MKLFKIAVLLILSVALIGGCAKKKEEAAQLEQEILNGDSAVEEVIDSTAVVAEESIIPEESEEPTAQYEMPSQPAGSGFTVQVASCPEEAYAHSLIEKYTSRGYEPFVEEITYGGDTYFRVRLGVFERYSQAKALQAELIDKYSAESWIDVTE